MQFREISGQEEIRQKLIGTITDQRVSHAQLFYGPEGSGKLELAIAYAQLLNCKGPLPAPLPQLGEGLGVGADACGSCPSCQQYQKLAHPDLHFIFPNNTTKRITSKPSSRQFIAEWRKFLLEHNFHVSLNEWYEELGIENKQGTINVRDAEEIIHTLGYKSYESEYKVMIIWMVEKLFHAAAPKLLKILEEPPEKTLFILISEDPGQVLPTIFSRCLPVRIPPRTVEFTEIAGEEHGNYEIFRRWMQSCYAGKIADLLNISSEIARTGREKQKSLLHYGLQTARLCSAFKYTGTMPSLAAPEQEFIMKFSRFFPAEQLGQFNELFNPAVYHVERNAHAPTLFLDLSLKMVRYFQPFRQG
jgi:DNA polymerase III subunit delta'